MKITLITWVLIGLPLLACALTRTNPVSSLFTVNELKFSVNDVTIPWAELGDRAWQQGAPLFEIDDAANSAFKAKGWMAATRDELLVRVDVYDAVHSNAYTGRNIRDGDFIQLAIDGKGDGAGRGSAETMGVFGADDANLCFALTGTGAEGWTFDTENRAYAGAYPVEWLDFSRDEATTITRYSIRLPWKRINVIPGVFPQFGLAVQVQNGDARQRNARCITWGAGGLEAKTAYYKLNQPGLYKKIGWEKPAWDIVAVAPLVTTIWQTGDDAQFVAAVASREDIAIRAEMGKTNYEYRVKGEATPGIRRFVLSCRPEGGMPNETINVSLVRNKENGPVASISAEVIIADAVVRQCVSRLDELIAGAGHPLFWRHLQSVKAMVQTEWARAAVYKTENTALASETLGLVGEIAEGFRGRSASWASYVKDGQSLFMAFISPRDGTLQWYGLTLPKGWDPEKHRDRQPAYPMFFELHGSQNRNYLFYPAEHLGMVTNDPALTTFAMIQRHGYHIRPFGRGNSGYRDIGETDIWEAYADAQEAVKIDPDRRYLYGFSMGGGGTWALGSRTPDRWAAMAVMGAGVRAEPWGQAANVSALPVYFWSGDTDIPKERLEEYAGEIRKAGGTVMVRSTPGIGHNYRIKEQEEALTWLQQFTRKRPAQFSFVADTDQHRGVWGINMTRNLTMSGLPRFTCKIEGNVIQVTTEGTPHIDIVLDEKGLGMKGEVTVTVNGKLRYQGIVPHELLRLDL